MTSARLTNSAARERFRALRFNSRRSGGANTILLKSRQPGYQKSLNKSLIYCTRNAGQNDGKTIERCENDDETVLDMDVPKVSLNLVFRGEELPRLHSIYFTSGSNTSVAEAPQDRDLARAIAVALLLFRTYSAYPEMTLFRLRAAKPAGLIDTILNAKKQSQSKSPICGLGNGAFLRLFLKPCSPTSRYMDIDLARLKPAAVEIILDGRTVSDPKIIKQMITLIAARKS